MGAPGQLLHTIEHVCVCCIPKPNTDETSLATNTSTIFNFCARTYGFCLDATQHRIQASFLIAAQHNPRQGKVQAVFYDVEYADGRMQTLPSDSKLLSKLNTEQDKGAGKGCWS